VDGARTLLAAELSADTRLVLELGAWLGLSTRYIADCAPNARIITVDTWEGSPEHRDNPALQTLLPHLQAAFWQSCWSYRNRITALRMTTLSGIETVARYSLAPDLIYIDAEHSYEAVLVELNLCYHHFPTAVLTGDDFAAPGVKQAVIEFAERHGFTVHQVGGWPAWKLAGNPAQLPSSRCQTQAIIART
jgi:hypothetical protein